MKQNSVPHILKSNDIQVMPETEFIHRLNPNAVRHTRSLSSVLGMKRLGIHLVRVEPGKESTQFHLHHQEEEFIYIIAGKGIAEIGEAEIEVAVGDFMGFTAPSLPHSLKNPFAQDLVYLMGGENRDFDICDYPKLKKRQFRSNRIRHLVDWEALQFIGGTATD